MQKIEQFDKNMTLFMERLGYQFKNKDILKKALSHSSYVNEKKALSITSNERLEFLGDSVLNLVISQHIYQHLETHTEGELTKIRAQIVCEASLVRCAVGLELGNMLLLGKGEELTGGRCRHSVLADAAEAVMGAVFVDGGLDPCRKLILNEMSAIIKESLNKDYMRDYKTYLQEWVQKISDCKIVYDIVDQKGPDHDKLFVIHVKIADEVAGYGEGKNKKEAEQNAAKNAMEKMRHE